jgi:hypothetical protein
MSFKPGFGPGRDSGSAFSSSMAIDASAVAVCFSTPSITPNTSAATTET